MPLCAFAPPSAPLPLSRARLRLRLRARCPTTAAADPPAGLDVPPPLHDRRVVVTAPRPYAARLLAPLAAAQARPVHLPAVRTRALPAEARAGLDGAVLTLSDYALVAFTSRAGVSAFAAALRDVVAGDAAVAAVALQASGAALAALGADAHAVRDMLGAVPDVVPPEPTPAGLAAFLAADGRWRGQQVLCPVPRVVGMPEPPVIPDFLAALKEAGCVPVPVHAYETSPVPRTAVQPELAWLLDGTADALVFSSTGEAQALHDMLEDDERAQLGERVQNGNLVAAAHGPVTAGGVRSIFGWTDVEVSDDFSSFQGVVDKLGQVYAQKASEAGELILPV